MRWKSHVRFSEGVAGCLHGTGFLSHYGQFIAKDQSYTIYNL